MQGVQNFWAKAWQMAIFTVTLKISHVSLTQAGEAVCTKNQTFYTTNRPNTDQCKNPWLLSLFIRTLCHVRRVSNMRFSQGETKRQQTSSAGTIMCKEESRIAVKC